MSPRRTEGWSAVPEDRAMVFGLTGCRSASDNNGTKDSEATGRAHPLVLRFRTSNVFQALMRQEVRASPLRGKEARIDGVQAFGGKIAMFWDRKILASPCSGRRVELLPVRQGEG